MYYPDVNIAQSIAGCCFRLLEELEANLSCFRPDSEVCRINSLKAGESMLLSSTTYRCLRKALEASEKTAGLFDATLGSQMQDNRIEPLCGRFSLSPDRPHIVCNEAGRKIDFGGIGKGFALEEMASTLKDQEVESALLSSGTSTHLAIGSRPWSFSLCGDRKPIEISLQEQAVSSSGIGIQGAHVIHPDLGISPAYHFKRVRVVADSATLADAFSTACLLMDPTEIESFQTAIGNIRIYVEPVGDSFIRQI